MNAAQGMNVVLALGDFVIALAFVALVLVQSFSFRRHRVISNIIALYLSFAAVTAVPWVSESTTLYNIFGVHVSVFLIVFVALAFLLSRSSLLQSMGGVPTGPRWHSLFFAAAQAGLLLSLVLTFLSAPDIAKLSDWTQYIFVSPAGRFGWILAPILGFLLFRDRKR